MSEIRVGNNSPSSYGGYSGGGSGSVLPKAQSFYEKLKFFEPLPSLEPLVFENPLASPLEKEIRAVLGGTLNINNFFVQLHTPLQQFLNRRAEAAFSSKSFANLERSNQVRVLKELLDTIESLDQEQWARWQAASKAEAAAKEERQRREQEVQLQQQRANETDTKKES